MRHNSLLIAIALSTSFIVADAAVARPSSGDQRSTLVRYGDLDLADPAGVATLDRRLEAAVSRICSPADSGDLISQREVRRCRAEARLSATSQRTHAIASAEQSRIQFSDRR